MSITKLERSRWDMVFSEVMDLYTTLHDSGNFRVVRAEMKQGEVRAEPIDFTADVDIKATRCLNTLGNPVFWVAIMRAPEKYPSIPEHIREALGKAFNDSKLGADGDYRTLYARTKQERT